MITQGKAVPGMRKPRVLTQFGSATRAPRRLVAGMCTSPCTQASRCQKLSLITSSSSLNSIVGILLGYLCRNRATTHRFAYFSWMQRPRHPDKEIEALIRECEARGWTVIRARKYYKGYCPCLRHQHSFKMTPSNPNWTRECLRFLRRLDCWERSQHD